MKRLVYNIFIMSFIVVLSGCQLDQEKPFSTLDYALTVEEDNSATIDFDNLIFNESNLVIKLSILTPPQHGKISISEKSSGDFSGLYIPNSNYIGSDSFVYQVSNGKFTSTGTINIIVTPVNDRPYSSGTELMVYENTTTTLDLSSLTYDEENNDLIYIIVDAPSKGLLSLNGTIINYTPNVNSTGSDSFLYRVFDGTSYSYEGYIEITIIPNNN